MVLLWIKVVVSACKILESKRGSYVRLKMFDKRNSGWIAEIKRSPDCFVPLLDVTKATAVVKYNNSVPSTCL